MRLENGAAWSHLHEGAANSYLRSIWHEQGTTMSLQLQWSQILVIDCRLHCTSGMPSAIKSIHFQNPAVCYREAELFDWLRGLAEGHELAHLCDVYTYTTLISQCGSHQQLRKALELVAEMRGRGISCNVHTYSALMNVCIKVGSPTHPAASSTPVRV